jgi:hypothetical protein
MKQEAAGENCIMRSITVFVASLERYEGILSLGRARRRWEETIAIELK